MDNKKLLNQIGTLIDNKLQPLKKDIKGVKKQLDTVELKVELVTSRVEEVSKKVEESQKDTSEVLSELINTGYNLHEKRIKKIENHLQIPNP